MNTHLVVVTDTGVYGYIGNSYTTYDFNPLNYFNMYDYVPKYNK